MAWDVICSWSSFVNAAANIYMIVYDLVLTLQSEKGTVDVVGHAGASTNYEAPLW